MVYFNNTVPKVTSVIFSYCDSVKSNVGLKNLLLCFLKIRILVLTKCIFSQLQGCVCCFLWYLDKNPSKQLNHQVKIIVRAMLNTCFDVFDEYRSCTFQITWDNHNSISLLLPPKVWKVFLCFHILKNQSFFMFKNAGFFIMVANRIVLQLQIQKFFSWKIRPIVERVTYIWQINNRCCFRSRLAGYFLPRSFMYILFSYR